MVFKKILINNKNELLKYKRYILELFNNCFQQEMDEELWNWAYIDNPNGSPIVSLYFDDEKLVGHYAVIPINLILNGDEIKAALSMTTMADSAYRRYGVFVSQAEDVYQKANELGYDLVYGFPNKKSAPGFKKRLQWVLDGNSYVAKLNKNDLLRLNEEKESCIRFNITKEESLNWRLSKPNQKYNKYQNNILKNHGDDFDIVFYNNDSIGLDMDASYNILISTNLDMFTDKKQFEYIFGYRLFNTALDGVTFKKDLIMSDVF